jgi:hypothetical protein
VPAALVGTLDGVAQLRRSRRLYGQVVFDVEGEGHGWAVARTTSKSGRPSAGRM